jgi:hypothetical protein
MVIGGFEMQVAKNPLFLARILVVDMVTDTGLEVGGYLGAAGAAPHRWNSG